VFTTRHLPLQIMVPNLSIILSNNLTVLVLHITNNHSSTTVHIIMLVKEQIFLPG